MTITNQPSGRKQKKVPSAAPHRLPSARERRPALAALAVLLIAGGAVLAGWLALRQSQTEAYLQISAQVNEGEQILGEDLKRVELPKEGVDFIAFDDAREVIDSYAQADLLEGTVLVPGMVGDRPALTDEESRIGLDLSPDQYPRGLAVGDEVIVYLLRDGGDASDARLQTRGVVRSLEAADTGSGAQVDVVIASACASELTSGSAENLVSLAQIATDAALTDDAEAAGCE